jgi:polysaccharide export outer membrane protein
MQSLIAFAAVLLLGSPTGGGWVANLSESSQNASAATAGDASVPSHQGADYVIGEDDVIHVDVWKEPELSATVPVRTDGKISIPLLNDVQASGLTPTELGASLAAKLKKYLDDPRVTVIVSQMNHQRIYVVGEVLRHGPMSLQPDMTVLQALATAGLTQFANAKKIYVLRSVNGVEQKFPVNYKRLLKGESMTQNIALKTGDTIVVP